MLLIRTLWFCSAALLGTAAMAQGTPAPTETAPSQEAALTKGELKAMRDFKMLDFNGDGKLSRTEVKLFPRLSAAFDDADTNRDNYVSYEEVREFEPDFFFDDQTGHVTSAALHVPSGHVRAGIANPPLVADEATERRKPKA